MKPKVLELFFAVFIPRGLFHSSVLAQAVDGQGIQDIRDPIHIPNPWLPWILTGSVLLLTVIIWRLLKYLRRRHEKKNQPVPLSAYEQARRDLIALIAAVGEYDDVTYSIEVSGILRHYIENHFSMPAPERTTEEFLPIAAEHPQIQGELEAILRDFLIQCDLVKFARQPLTMDQRRQLGNTAERFLTESYKRSLDSMVPAEKANITATTT